MFVIVLFLFFWIISILGWLMEVLVCSLESGKFTNRGFLIGPYCPIYGFGGLILLSLSYFDDHLFIVFILSFLLCSLLEYIVSYLMEKLFKVRWWDYSNDPYNLNGRICLRNALAFGILGMILVCLVNPLIFNFLNGFSDKTLIIIGLITLIITVVDIAISFKVMNNIKESIKNLNDKNILRDATNDIKKLIKTNLIEKSFLYRRFVNAYDKFECYRNEFKDRVTQLKINHNYKLEYLKTIRGHLLIIFLISGIISGLILELIIKDYRYSFIMGFGLCIIIGSLYDKIRKK